jgi:hypothetical protein
LLDQRPRAVVLIDGLFDERPAIRHKELLSLMTAGIPVIGGASMGALRAAELQVHGMVGVGSIFQAFARGTLDGDDEVAVLHGPAEWDWAPLTVPLVDVRATLIVAVRQRIVPASMARLALRIARATFYKERTWNGILGSLGDDATVAPQSWLRFEQWLPEGRVYLKQIDALHCLSSAKTIGGQVPGPAPPETLFTLELRDWVRRTASH